MAALTSLSMAREWFERGFAEVHVYSPETHPPGIPANLCPNETPYVEVVNGRLKNEGESVDPSETAVSDWFGAVIQLWELHGRPPFLWWRIVPEMERDGYVYSRLAMTHRSAYQSYRGKPLERAA